MKFELYKNYKKANLGMSLEEAINQSNDYYRHNKIAIINKKPTPIQVVKVNYPSRNKCKIVEAYYKIPSTTDYNGIYNKYYIDFDVKETHNKTAIPLNNIKDHQINHLKSIYHQGGLAFLIIYFAMHDTYFLLPYKTYLIFKELYPNRQSIPYTFFQEYCLVVKHGYIPRIDYLAPIMPNLSKFLLN